MSQSSSEGSGDAGRVKRGSNPGLWVEWLRKGELLCARFGAAILIIFALVYYGQYYRHDLNLGGEGGTVAVIALRLIEGQKPIVDTFLGYNVLWFYPVAWLFELAGPNYVALRWFFFALCAITGVLAFLIVRRVSSSGAAGVLVGALVILIPGMAFRNYMGLLPVLNAWTFLHAFVFEKKEARARIGWMAAAGASLGLTYLVRVDVGAFFTVIFAGLAALFPFGVPNAFRQRASIVFGGALLGALVAVALHLPFYLDARSRKYDQAFVGQYTAIWEMLRYEVFRRISTKPSKNRSAAGTRAAQVPGTRNLAGANPAGAAFERIRFRSLSSWREDERQKLRASEEQQRQALEEQQRKVLPRKSLAEMLEAGSFYEAAFVIALHAPIAISGVILASGAVALCFSIAARNGEVKQASLIALVTLGSALTLFPQYFFFRPDTPHLSEFMVPFVVAMACSSILALKAASRTRNIAVKAAAYAFIAACAAEEAVYFYHSFPKESAGTIAARRKRRSEFIADNGVHVWVKKGEAVWMKGIYEAVVRHSDRDDWVITYPYSPTINFMTNRRSYLYNLYVDNATASKDFNQRSVAEIEQLKPAVIVVDNRDINQTEFSRFLNWARPTWDYIRQKYVLAGKFNEDEIEVYVRPDKLVPRA